MAIRDIAATTSERAQAVGASATRPRLSVVEVGVGYACRYAGRVLADQGASVTRIVPQEASMSASTWLDRGKDILDAPNVAALLYNADLCLTDRPDLVGPAASTAMPRPSGLERLVVVEIGYPAAEPNSNVLIAATSGAGAAIGEPDGTPLAPPGRILEGLAGLHAAAAGLAAVEGARRDGVGEHVFVDPAGCIAGMTAVAAIQYLNYGGRLFRDGRSAYQSGGPYPNRIFRARDGWVVGICRSKDEWDAFLALLGNPAWGAEPRYRDQIAMAKEYPDEVTALIEEILAEWSVADLWKRAKEFRAPLSPVRSVEDVMNDELLVRRGTDGEIDLVPAIDRVPNPQPHEPAAFRPLPGLRRQDPTPPLAGLKVLDLGWVWAAPAAAAWLADLGADVVKVESLDRLDVARRRGIEFPVSGPGGPSPLPPYERAYVFAAANRNKRSVSLNLKAPEEQEQFLQLVSRTHVLVESFSAGVLERMGLPVERLFKANPDLIVVSLGGATIDGSYVGRSYAPILSALAGVESAVRDANGEVLGMMSWGAADPSGGSWALFGVLSCLSQGISGVHLQVSQLRGVVNSCAALYHDGALAEPILGIPAEEITLDHIAGVAKGPLGDLFRQVTVKSWDPSAGERIGFANPWQFRRMQVGVRCGAPLLGNVEYSALLHEWDGGE